MDFSIGGVSHTLLPTREEFLKKIEKLTDLQKTWLITLFDEKHPPCYNQKLHEKINGKDCYCPLGVAALVCNSVKSIDLLTDSEVEFDGSTTEFARYRKLELIDRHGQLKSYILVKGQTIKFITHFTDILKMSHKQVACQIAKSPDNYFSKEPYFTNHINFYVK